MALVSPPQSPPIYHVLAQSLLITLRLNSEEAFQDGLDQHGFVKSISYHQYAARNQEWVRLQNSYMNHTANAHNVTQYENIIESCHEYHPALPFVLGETNSNSYNLNMSQIEGVFGSALWLIDHLLMGMATNITRYNLIQGTTFGYSAWVPVTRDGVKPHVRAPLYGQIFAADVLGHHPKVQVYPIPQLPWNVSAYGIYESGGLAKYVVINFDEWNSTTRYERPVQKITLDLPLWVKNVKVERLTANGASADNDIKWAGQSWNYTSGRSRLTSTAVQLQSYRLSQRRVSSGLFETVNSGRVYRGCAMGDCYPQEFIPKLIEACQAGRFPFTDIMHQYAATKVKEAISRLSAVNLLN
ncbi:Glycoside hydrolase family 79 protein [Ilyonectria robusta]